MVVINKQMLEQGTNNSNIAGVILVKNYGTALTKNNKEYQSGILMAGTEIQFKAWDNSSAFKELKDNDYSNVVAYIQGKFNEFNGQMSLIIDTVQAVEGYEVSQFLPVKYNTQAYWDALVKTVTAKLSPFALQLANKVLFENEEVAEKFKTEFAAASHHDNCVSGLLAHTFKVISGVSHIVSNYPALVKKSDGTPDTDRLDVLYLGALFHDLGKIREMNLGVYQSVSTVTHRYLGVEYIAPYKDEIVENYSEEWYYDLISVLLQHHGEFGDPCRTVSAYIVHKADLLDSEMTLLLQKLETPISNPSSGDTVKIDGQYLTI